MANYFLLELDTLGPSSPSISLAGGSAYINQQLIIATIGTSDTPTTGYQMKIWGNVDTTYDSNIQASEGASSWITYSTSKQIKLAANDGSKSIYLKIRDDVYNESSQVSASIILDMSAPAVTIIGPDVSKISKNAGKNVSSFSFTADGGFVEFKVKAVGAIGSTHDTGNQIGTTSGSTNMTGNAGNYAASTPINCQITGADLETAAGIGSKIIKVFVKDASGNWSV